MVKGAASCCGGFSTTALKTGPAGVPMPFEAPGVGVGKKLHAEDGSGEPRPKDQLSNCGGDTGANALTTVTPSGATNARYSPSAASWKLVWRGPEGSLRSFPEAKTIK